MKKIILAIAAFLATLACLAAVLPKQDVRAVHDAGPYLNGGYAPDREFAFERVFRASRAPGTSGAASGTPTRPSPRT